MANVKTVAFDAAEFLDTAEAQAAYLQEAFATGDAAYIARSIGTVARARGMSAIARDARVGRESLYKALSGEGNPEFGTIVKVLSALNLALSVEPRAPGGGRGVPRRRAPRSGAAKPARKRQASA